MNRLKQLLILTLSLYNLSCMAQVEIAPDDPNIHIKGANYIQEKDGEMIIHRHSDKVYAGTTKSNLFNPVKARTGSGIYIAFKTKSPKIVARFKIAKGLKKGGIFSVFKDGKFYKNYPFKYQENGLFSIEIANKQGKAETFCKTSLLYRITFPLKTDIHFLGLTLENGFGLSEIEDADEGIYVAYGDSITHGTGQKTTPDTYAYQLAEKLHYELYNTAVGGSKTSQVMAEMIRDDFRHIDLMTILTGFNDYNGEGISPEKYEARYRKLLQTIRETHPDTKIYCITLLTTKQKKSKTSGINIESFRKVVRKIVAERQQNGDKNIYLIEGDKITTESDLKDKVHLNPEGAQNFADALYKIIKK